MTWSVVFLELCYRVEGLGVCAGSASCLPGWDAVHSEVSVPHVREAALKAFLFRSSWLSMGLGSWSCDSSRSLALALCSFLLAFLCFCVHSQRGSLGEKQPDAIWPQLLYCCLQSWSLLLCGSSALVCCHVYSLNRSGLTSWGSFPNMLKWAFGNGGYVSFQREPDFHKISFVTVLVTLTLGSLLSPNFCGGLSLGVSGGVDRSSSFRWRSVTARVTPGSRAGIPFPICWGGSTISFSLKLKIEDLEGSHRGNRNWFCLKLPWLA